MSESYYDNYRLHEVGKKYKPAFASLNRQKLYETLLEFNPNLYPYVEYGQQIHLKRSIDYCHLLESAKQGNKKSIEQVFDILWHKVLNVALTLSCKYKFDLEECIHNGFMGVHKCINCITPSDYYNLSSFSTKYIRESIILSSFDKTHIVSRYLYVEMIDSAEQLIELYLDYCLTYKELTEKIKRLGFSFEAVDRVLYALLGEDFELSEVDVADTLSMEEYIDRHSLLPNILYDVLDTLTPRERKVLSLRYGLIDGIPHTLEEVADIMRNDFPYSYLGYPTRERIRQIEAKAMRKMRHPARSKQLKYFLD